MHGRVGILLTCTACLLASCATTPHDGPGSPETVPRLSGTFIGMVRITDNFSSQESRSARADVSISFLDGEYSVTADGEVVQSSVGDYFQGQRLLLQQRSSEYGAVSRRVLVGYFDYSWGGNLLVLEQWDATRDRLVEVILERISPARPLLPEPTPGADRRAPRRQARALSG